MSTDLLDRDSRIGQLLEILRTEVDLFIKCWQTEDAALDPPDYDKKISAYLHRQLVGAEDELADMEQEAATMSIESPEDLAESRLEAKIAPALRSMLKLIRESEEQDCEKISDRQAHPFKTEAGFEADQYGKRIFLLIVNDLSPALNFATSKESQAVASALIECHNQLFQAFPFSGLSSRFGGHKQGQAPRRYFLVRSLDDAFVHLAAQVPKTKWYWLRALVWLNYYDVAFWLLSWWRKWKKR